MPVPLGDTVLLPVCLASAEPVLTAIRPDGTITWSSGGTQHAATVEVTTMIPPEHWLPAVSMASTGSVMSVQFATNEHALAVFRVRESDVSAVPPGMVLVPEGEAQLGDHHGVAGNDAVTLHVPSISTCYMDEREVTKALWDEVTEWAVTNGYVFANPGAGVDPAHPVHTVNWYDVIKW